MLDMNTDEWVVYRVTQDNQKVALGCETRADWDEWERRYRSGHARDKAEWETVELIASGLTRDRALQLVLLAKE